jgi:hypothetical protein
MFVEFVRHPAGPLPLKLFQSTTLFSFPAEDMRLKFAVILGSLALSACSPRSPDRDLEGRWRAAFVLDSTWRLGSQPRAHALSGVLALGPVPATSPEGDSVPVVHAGHVTVDFEPFGFKLWHDEALGWHMSQDSVRIILDPTVDHGLVELIGTQRGDRIQGRWQLISDPSGAVGAFTLDRVAP